ncbi:unnamed protein product [Closterium sp. NIES-53]
MALAHAPSTALPRCLSRGPFLKNQLLRSSPSRARCTPARLARHTSASLAEATSRSLAVAVQSLTSSRLERDSTNASESPAAFTVSRRQSLLTLWAVASAVCGDGLFLLPPPAAAADGDSPSTLQRGLSRYIKKKKLDPLESFVPSVLLTREQLLLVQAVVDDQASSPEDLNQARALLRAGPAGTLRGDLRALTRYAAEGAAAGLAYTPGGDGYFPGSPEAGAVASAAADRCLEALSGLDTLLRLNQPDGRARMAKQATAAVSALDEVLATVPEAIMAKSEAIVAKYLVPAADNAADSAASADNVAENEGGADSGGLGQGVDNNGPGESGSGTVRRLGQKKSKEELLESLL